MHVADAFGHACVFPSQYDKNHSGALELDEFHHVLADLGMLVNTEP